ncbi:glycoside hydrolase superfamily [Aspergillus nidulans var. acristatus]
MMSLSSVTVAVVASVLPYLVSAAGLNEAAHAAGLEYFGTGVDNPALADPPYLVGLNNVADFGSITIGNAQKWENSEPTQGNFDFSDGDILADLADANGQLLRCHTLIWHYQLPSWVWGGTWTNKTLIEAMQNHITQVVSHYRGRCHHWDVLNEALNDDGTLRSSIFLQTIGEAYIPIAFAAAAAADPDAKLYYNDYGIEYGGDKLNGVKYIIDLIRAYGGKIDGVGFQGHFWAYSVPDKDYLKGVLKSAVAFDVEVAYTEVDDNIELPADSNELAQQATEYQNIVEACVETEGCVGITIWDWTDKYSWIPDVFPGRGAALPWDENYSKKPAYWGILEGFSGN